MVEALGEGVDTFAAGDAVYASAGGGAYAELAVVRADRAARAPETLDLVDAGAAPIGPSTALEGLDDHLRISRADTVLIAGAAGGVGALPSIVWAPRPGSSASPRSGRVGAR